MHEKKIDVFLKRIHGIASIGATIISLIALIMTINTFSYVQKTFEMEYATRLHFGVETMNTGVTTTNYRFTVTNDSIRQQISIKEIYIKPPNTNLHVTLFGNSEEPKRLSNGECFSLDFSDEELNRLCTIKSGLNYVFVVVDTSEKRWSYSITL